MIAFLAVVRLGAVAVSVNYGLPFQDAGELLNHADVNFLIFGEMRKKTVPEILTFWQEKCPGGGYFELCDENFSRMTDREPIELPLLPEENPDRTAVLVFTTGTTAIPKIVCLSQREILFDSYYAADRFCSGTLGDLLLGLPLFHCYGLTSTLCYMVRGRCVYLPDNLNPECMLAILEQHAPDVICSVESMFVSIFQSERFTKHLYKQIRICVFGGGFTAPAQLRAFHSAFPNIAFLVGYGQSEASPIISVASVLDTVEKRCTTVGRPLYGVELEIHAQDDTVLPINQVGEICLRGKMVMNGYFGVKDEVQPIDANGFLHTGDLGFVDEEGYLCLTGRIKDIIIKKGENISPLEIESAILRCVGVKAVKVLGFLRPGDGEGIAACIVMKAGYHFSEIRIKEELEKYLHHFKHPEVFMLLPNLPETNSGKTDVMFLKRMLGEFLQSQRNVIPGMEVL